VITLVIYTGTEVGF